MATAAAAVIARARRKVMGHFLSQNAVSPENALPFASDRRLERRQFERMCAAGVIREAKPGIYYVDVPAWHEWSTRLHQRLLIAVVSVALITVLAIVLAGR